MRLSETEQVALDKLNEKLEQELGVDRQQFLLELAQGEKLVAILKPGDEQHAEAKEKLSRIYQVMVNSLYLLVREMKYPQQPTEWMDSRPLEMLAEAFPDIQGTAFYQHWLSEIMFPTGRPYPPM